MSIATDSRGVPGDLVLVRGNRDIRVFQEQPVSGNITQRLQPVGIVNKKSIGMIVCLDDMGCTYVLWSNPCLCGWVYDGELRRV